MADTIELETLLRYYENSSEAFFDARKNAERDRDFYDNKQLTSEEVSALKARGQNSVVFNRIASKIDFLIGAERQTRTDPKAYPRTPAHEESAHSASDAINFVCDNNDFDQIASDAAQNLFIEGVEAVSVEVIPKNGNFEVTINYIEWDRLIYDHHSSRRQFQDARYTGVVLWMDLEEAKQRYRGKSENLDTLMNNHNTFGTTYDDKPKWFDKQRRRVMVIQMYFKHQGRWHHATFTKGAYLEGPAVSPYLDEDGLPENPHILACAKIDRENNRYGAVRSLIDPQKEINARRSKFLWQMSCRQTMGEKGAVDDIYEMRRNINKADGHIEKNAGTELEILNTNDLSQGQFALYQDATQQIDATGVNATLQGKDDKDLSGRAQLARSQQGMLELGPFFDTHRAWKRRIYRAIWNRIKQFWDDERWIRVTDDADNLKWVGLNTKVTLAEMTVMENSGMGLSEVRNKFGKEIQALASQNPGLAEVVQIKNDISELDVDILIEEQPNIINLQTEEFDKLVRLFEANPSGIPWDMIIEASSIRGKNRILNKMRPSPEAEEQQAKVQQQAQALQMSEQQGKVKKVNAEAEKTQAQADQTNLENQLLLLQPKAVTSVSI